MEAAARATNSKTCLANKPTSYYNTPCRRRAFSTGAERPAAAKGRPKMQKRRGPEPSDDAPKLHAFPHLICHVLYISRTKQALQQI